MILVACWLWLGAPTLAEEPGRCDAADGSLRATVDGFSLSARDERITFEATEFPALSVETAPEGPPASLAARDEKGTSFEIITAPKAWLLRFGGQEVSLPHDFVKVTGTEAIGEG